MKLFCQAKDYRLDLRALSAIAITIAMASAIAEDPW